MRDNTAITGTPTGPRGARLRTRLDTFRATRRRGSIGLPEFVALALSALLLLAAVLAYLFLLVPQNSRTQALNSERQDLERLLQSQQTNIGEGKDTQQRVSEILTSLERFQIEHLGQSGSGTKTVIEELNRLIIKDNLRISGGVNYTVLQEAVPGEEDTRQRRGNEENAQRVVQSIFPGIGVTLTVEGTYPNLRRFIRDIEADRQFVVINTVELEGVTDSNSGSNSGEAPAPVSADGSASTAAQASNPSRGALVSLRLDLAAYFRRAAAAE